MIYDIIANGTVTDDDLVLSGTFTGCDWNSSLSAGIRITPASSGITIRGMGDPEATVIDCLNDDRAFFVESLADVHIQNLTIMRGHALEGGGVYGEQFSGALMFTHVHFRLNNVFDTSGTNEARGGAVFADTPDYLEFESCVFEGNYAGDSEGSIRLSPPPDGEPVRRVLPIGDDPLLFDGWIFGAGGAVYSTGDTRIYNSLFVDQGAEKGGAVYYAGYTALQVENTVVRNAVADVGSAFYVTGATLILDRVHISNCGMYKGVIFLINAAVQMDMCVIDNSLPINGVSYGALMIVDGPSGIVSMPPPSRRSGLHSRAFARYQAEITNCNFTNNEARMSFGDGGSGGAIFCQLADPSGAPCVNMRNSRFEGNFAEKSGGALFLSSRCDIGDFCQFDEDIIDNCDFIGNVASLQGGALYLNRYGYDVDPAVEVFGSRFINNYATDGAAWASAAGRIEFQGALFAGNEADRYGGVGFLSRQDAFRLEVWLISCTAIDNYADAGGGVLYAFLADVEINQGKYQQNFATLGGVFAGIGSVFLFEGEFENNTAIDGGVVYAIDSEISSAMEFRRRSASLKDGDDGDSASPVFQPTAREAIDPSASRDAYPPLPPVDGTQCLSACDDPASPTCRQCCTTVRHEHDWKCGHASEAECCRTWSPECWDRSMPDNKNHACNQCIPLPTFGNLFTNNTAYGKGGAFYLARCDLYMEDFTIRENFATEGGGIYFSNYEGVRIRRMTLEKNEAIRGGGAFLDGGYYWMDQCNFDGNSAMSDDGMSGGDGAALYVAEGSVVLDECDFSSNSADGNGGAVFSELSLVQFEGGYVGFNKARNGGGAYIVERKGRPSRFTSKVTGTWMEDNVATENGGALFVSCNVPIEHGFLQFNNASVGGAVYFEANEASCTPAVPNVNCFDNIADRGGCFFLGASTGALNGSTGLGYARNTAQWHGDNVTSEASSFAWARAPRASVRSGDHVTDTVAGPAVVTYDVFGAAIHYPDLHVVLEAPAAGVTLVGATIQPVLPETAFPNTILLTESTGPTSLVVRDIRGLATPLITPVSVAACDGGFTASGFDIGKCACQSGLLQNFSSTTTLACLACPAGHFVFEDISCVPCPPGTASAVPGAPACIPCPPGQHQPSAGMSACFPCPPDTVSSTSGTDTCYPCPAGSVAFANATGCQVEATNDDGGVGGTLAPNPCAPPPPVIEEPEDLTWVSALAGIIGGGCCIIPIICCCRALARKKKVQENKDAYKAALAAGGEEVEVYTNDVNMAVYISEMLKGGLMPVLGKGGFAIVYQMEHPVTDEPVALKVLIRQDPDDLADFRNELRILGHLAKAGVSHPNVADLKLCCEDKELDVIALAVTFCDGGTSRAYMEKRMAKAPAQRLELARQTAAGMHFLHKNWVAHLDLKDKNVLISKGEPKVMDFGTSTLVGETGEPIVPADNDFVAGTPQYIAPERLSSAPHVDLRGCDVYAFGIMLYTFWQLEDPYEGEKPMKVMARVSKEPNFRPTIPESCHACTVTLMQKCWAHDPAARPTFGQAIADLDHCLQNCFGLTPPADGVELQEFSRPVPTLKTVDEADAHISAQMESYTADKGDTTVVVDPATVSNGANGTAPAATDSTARVDPNSYSNGANGSATATLPSVADSTARVDPESFNNGANGSVSSVPSTAATASVPPDVTARVDPATITNGANGSVSPNPSVAPDVTARVDPASINNGANGSVTSTPSIAPDATARVDPASFANGSNGVSLDSVVLQSSDGPMMDATPNPLNAAGSSTTDIQSVAGNMQSTGPVSTSAAAPAEPPTGAVLPSTAAPQPAAAALDADATARVDPRAIEASHGITDPDTTARIDPSTL